MAAAVPTQRKKKARGWLIAGVVLGAAVLIGGWAQCAGESNRAIEPPQPLSSPPLAPMAAVVQPVRLEEPLVPDAGGVLELAAVRPDAGLTDRQRIEQTLLRWRDALAPLFKPDRRKGHQPAAVIAVSSDPRAPSPEQPQCEDAVERWPLHGVGSVDLVIAIDTSGSMIGELKDVVVWLSELELALRAKGLDFQLVVVADQRRLYRGSKRRELDAGQLQVEIDSRDALEALITATREGPAPHWQQLLRPGSTKHLVVVTDDEANDPTGLPYLAPLIKSAGGALGGVGAPAFVLHLLGGFSAVPPGELLAAEQPLAVGLCPGGVAAGLGYQRLSQQTGGTRASLCQPASYRALTQALVHWPLFNELIPCVWLIRRESTVVEARAMRGSFAGLRLSEAGTAEACLRRSDGYRISGPIFALCGSTCSALVDGGYDAVEVSTRCDH